MPAVSIIMSVYNGERFLLQCIGSVLEQTFGDFEFIIINDCSTDSTLEILNSYQDSRIRIISKNKNKGFSGFVENLNIGITEAKGKYIARMDADDICLPKRLEMQVRFLEQHPHIFLVGTSAEKIDENNKKIGDFRAETNPGALRKKLLKDNAIYHPTIMFRNSGNNYYRDKFVGCEDYDFYLRKLSDGMLLGNLPDMLLRYRILGSSISRSENKFIRKLFVETCKKFFYQRQNKFEDDYELLDITKLQHIFEPLTENSLQELLFACKTAVKYNDKKSLDLIVKKIRKEGVSISSLTYRLLLNLPSPFFELWGKILNRYA